MDTKEIKQELEELLKSTERKIEGVSSVYDRNEYGTALIEGVKITLNLFKKDLEELLGKIEKSTPTPKYLLCTRSENRLFTVGKKYEILKTASNGSFSVKEDIFDCEMGVPLKGEVWEFELVSDEEQEKPKLLCTYSFSEYSEFRKGKTYEIIEKIDDDRFLTRDERGMEGVVPLNGGLWKFDLV